MTIPSTPYGGPTQWGAILQQPYTEVDAGAAERRRAMWMARQNAMTGAQETELAQLNAALQAQRDAKMAELAAQDAARGGGGGGRGGGGGGSGPATMLPTAPVPESDWYNQLAGMYANQTAPAPAWNNQLPGDIYAPNPFLANMKVAVKATPNRGKLARATPALRPTLPKPASKVRRVLS